MQQSPSKSQQVKVRCDIHEVAGTYQLGARYEGGPGSRELRVRGVMRGRRRRSAVDSRAGGAVGDWGWAGKNWRRGKEIKTESKGVGWGALRLWVQINGSRCISAARYLTEPSQSRTRSNPDRARTSRLVFSSSQVQASPRAFLPVLMMCPFLMLDVEEHIPNIYYFSTFNVWYWSIIEEDKTKCDLLLEIILPFFWCYGYIMD